VFIKIMYNPTLSEQGVQINAHMQYVKG